MAASPSSLPRYNSNVDVYGNLKLNSQMPHASSILYWLYYNLHVTLAGPQTNVMYWQQDGLCAAVKLSSLRSGQLVLVLR